MTRVKLPATAIAVLVLCLSCAAETPPVAGLAESEAGTTESTASQGPDPTTNDGAGDTTSTVAASGDAPATTASGTDSGGDSAVATIGSEIVLVSADNEMNTQPDDEEWALLSVPSAYTALIVDDYAATNETKLVVVDVGLTTVRPGNVFEEAFRLEADGTWYSPLNNINSTTRIGVVLNTSLVFEVPRASTTVTLEGGLPEAVGVGRRASYEISFTPGTPPESTVSDDQVAATASQIALTSETKEMNTQPDDNEWATLEVNEARTAVIEGDFTANRQTKLVLIDVALTMGDGGNVFDQSLRLGADGRWYSPLNNINQTAKVGEILNHTFVFEIPRDQTDLTLEGGFPSALAGYDWNFSLRTATYDITFG